MLAFAQKDKAGLCFFVSICLHRCFKHANWLSEEGEMEKKQINEIDIQNFRALDDLLQLP